jgi:hypothetical protein
VKNEYFFAVMDDKDQYKQPWNNQLPNIFHRRRKIPL